MVEYKKHFFVFEYAYCGDDFLNNLTTVKHQDKIIGKCPENYEAIEKLAIQYLEEDYLKDVKLSKK